MKTTAARRLALAQWLQDPKNEATIPWRLACCGYVPVCNPDAEDGRWVVEGKHQVIYGKAALSPEQRLAAARKLVRRQ